MEYRSNRIKNEREILIIGPCPFEKDKNYLSLLESLPILAIDKGIEHLDSIDDAISIGDGDSTNIEMNIKLDPIKDKSDLAVGLEFLGNETKLIHLYGFLGLRKDHELINFGEVYRYVSKTASSARFEENILMLPKGTNTINISSTFSLISLVENEITITGNCKYQLRSPTKIDCLSSHGLSNEGSGEVEIHSTRPIMLTVNVDEVGNS